MLCYTLLCYVVPPLVLPQPLSCYTMLCHAMLCHVVLRYVLQCYGMVCYVISCYGPPDHQTTRPPAQTTRPPDHQTTRPPDHQISASLCNSLRQTTRPQAPNCRFEVEDQRAKEIVRTPTVSTDTIFGEWISGGPGSSTCKPVLKWFRPARGWWKSKSLTQANRSFFSMSLVRN